MSFVAIPATGVCPRYFKRNRGLATGISVAGSSLGGVIWPIACDQLLHTDGLTFAWTIRIVGFIMIPLLVIVVLTVRPPLEPKQGEESSNDENEKLQDKKQHRAALRQPPFILLCSGLFLGYLGFFSPFFYISTYATSLGLSQGLSFYLVSIVNGASMFGRVLPGFWADRFGRFNVLIVSALFAGMIIFCWTAVRGVAGLVVWTAAYGFASGVCTTLYLLIVRGFGANVMSRPSKVCSSHAGLHSSTRLPRELQ